MGAKLSPLDARTLDGESETIELKEKPPCEHYFDYKTAGEVLCRKCNMGFFIQADEYLKKGHLHKGDKLLF